MKEDTIYFRGTSSNIVCKNCVRAMLEGYKSSTCGEYSFKPHDVYYEGKPCPKFKENTEGWTIKE